MGRRELGWAALKRGMRLRKVILCRHLLFGSRIDPPPNFFRRLRQRRGLSLSLLPVWEGDKTDEAFAGGPGLDFGYEYNRAEWEAHNDSVNQVGELLVHCSRERDSSSRLGRRTPLKGRT